MNIPLDELYNFLTSHVADSMLIYHFHPHGSRKLEDLKQLHNNSNLQQCCFVIMHDQEPLAPDFYHPEYMKKHVRQWYQTIHGSKTAAVLDNCPSWADRVYNSNLAFARLGRTEYDHNILVHSEKRSQELEFYHGLGFESVYWWSHALIARDWYRYAQHDPLLQWQRSPNLLFNIYARAWRHPREYRLKLLDLVIEHDLVSCSNIKFNCYDENQHYRQHCFHNESFRPHHCLDIFAKSEASPSASASYSSHDYQTSWIDIVLETLFDDQRLHLTEKSLRPIACGVPFVLCGTQGSLKYLRSYGFKTFHDFFDESYDEIGDPNQRLLAVIRTMKTIKDRDLVNDSHVRFEIQKICDHNRSRFFSQEFCTDVLEEFYHNFEFARQSCEIHRQGRLRAELQACCISDQ
jgi:hypothetical protein